MGLPRHKKDEKNIFKRTFFFHFLTNLQNISIWCYSYQKRVNSSFLYKKRLISKKNFWKNVWNPIKRMWGWWLNQGSVAEILQGAWTLRVVLLPENHSSVWYGIKNFQHLSSRKNTLYFKKIIAVVSANVSQITQECLKWCLQDVLKGSLHQHRALVEPLQGTFHCIFIISFLANPQKFIQSHRT